MADYNQPDYVEKRVRYFDGQFLKDQDFIDEQKYFLDRQRRYHRFLNVSGIVDGLAVRVKPGTTDLVTVDPGTALDIKGRQVVLSNLVPETDRQVPLQRQRGTTGTLVITYNEEGSDQAQDGSARPTRFYEKPKLTMVLSGQTVPEGAITLARLAISASGVVEVNNTVRIYAGIRLPYDGAASDHGPELRAGSANRLEVNSDLSVSGDVNVGRANAQAKLYVNGTMQIAGTNTLEFGAGVSGKEASAGKIGYQTLTSDALDIVGAGTTGSDRKLKFWAEGGATLTGSLSVNGSVGIGTNDPGSDKLKVDGTLSVTGASTLTGNTSIGGTLTVTKASTLTDNTSIGGTLTVTKASTLTGNVAIGTPTAKSPLQIKTLTAIAEQATGAGAWANFGSNAYADDTWKRIDETKAGVNFHLNADGEGQEFRFSRVEANGLNKRNIAALGSKVSYILESNVGIGTNDPGTDRLKVNGTLNVTGTSTLRETNVMGSLNVEKIAFNTARVTLHGDGTVSIGDPLPSNPYSNETTAKLNVSGSISERLETILVGRAGRLDWENDRTHPVMAFFSKKLAGKPVGTMIRAISDHDKWKGFYWEGWVDVDQNVRVAFNAYEAKILPRR